MPSELDNINLTDEPTKPVDSSTKDFGMKERLIATLLFDTQPKRRAAFVERFGYELNPKDDNLIKPIGADDEQYFPIDPGGIFDFKKYGKTGKMPSTFGQGMLESVIDILEGASDVAQGTAIEAGGDVSAVGGPVALAAGRGAGRMATFNAIESAKDAIGNIFLDKEIPVDYGIRATQSAIQAVGPEALSGAVSKGKDILSGTAKLVSKGVRNLLNIGDGTIGNQAWNAIIKNPEIVADENKLVKAGSGLDSSVEQLIGGHNKSTADFSNTAYQRKMNELEPLRKLEAEKLSMDRNLDAPIDKIINLFESAKLDLARPDIKSQSRKDGIAYLQNHIDSLKSARESMSGNLPGPEAGRYNFGQVDEMVKELQKDLYSKKTLNVDWRDAIKKVVDGDGGLNTLLKNAATNAGSPYASIKQQESKLFSAFEDNVQNIDAAKVRRFTMGDDLMSPKGTSTDTTARLFRESVAKTDDALGTDFYNQFRTGQIQNKYWEQLNKQGPRGSGGSLIPALAAGSTVGGAVASKTGSPGLGFVAGGLAAAPVYALTQPRFGTKTAVGAAKLGNAIEGIGVPEALQPSADMAKMLATRGIAQGVEGEDRSKPQELSINDINLNDELSNIDLNQ